jgi:histone H1/5
MANISFPRLSKRKSKSPKRFSFDETKKTERIYSPSKKTATKNPTYLEMIKEAISELKERSGSSGIAITKYIVNKYKVVSTFRSRLKTALKKAVKEGKVTQVKKSFKLPTTEKRRAAKQKKSPSKLVKSPDVHININAFSPGNSRYSHHASQTISSNRIF